MKRIKIVTAMLIGIILSATVFVMSACNDGTAFTVTLDANGGAFKDGSTQKDVEVNIEYTLGDNIETPTRDGWTFVGYTYDKNGSGGKVVFGLDGDKFKSSATLYAQWMPWGIYTITFDGNGGTITGGKTGTTESGKLAELPDDTRVSYAGYTFSGWFTDAEDGEEITLNTVFEADTTIYAHWIEDDDSEEPAPSRTEYTITFDGNGGTIAVANELLTANGKLVSLIDGAVVVKAGYTFDGWYTEATGGEEITLHTVFTANTMVYAHWTEASAADPE